AGDSHRLTFELDQACLLEPDELFAIPRTNIHTEFSKMRLEINTILQSEFQKERLALKIIRGEADALCYWRFASFNSLEILVKISGVGPSYPAVVTGSRYPKCPVRCSLPILQVMARFIAPASPIGNLVVIITTGCGALD